MAQLSADKMTEMIDLCVGMLDKAYCVYSKFPVASVLLTDCGKTFTGCNVENSSYGLCICAERTAAVKAVSEGYRKFQACFVATKSNRAIPPCGACRQFLAEFGPRMSLYLINKDRQCSSMKLDDLLPLAFNQEELQSGIIKQ